MLIENEPAPETATPTKTPPPVETARPIVTAWMTEVDVALTVTPAPELTVDASILARVVLPIRFVAADAPTPTAPPPPYPPPTAAAAAPPCA